MIVNNIILNLTIIIEFLVFYYYTDILSPYILGLKAKANYRNFHEDQVFIFQWIIQIQI